MRLCTLASDCVGKCQHVLGYCNRYFPLQPTNTKQLRAYSATTTSRHDCPADRTTRAQLVCAALLSFSIPRCLALANPPSGIELGPTTTENTSLGDYTAAALHLMAEERDLAKPSTSTTTCTSTSTRTTSITRTITDPHVTATEICTASRGQCVPYSAAAASAREDQPYVPVPTGDFGLEGPGLGVGLQRAFRCPHPHPRPRPV